MRFLMNLVRREQREREREKGERKRKKGGEKGRELERGAWWKGETMDGKSEEWKK